MTSTSTATDDDPEPQASLQPGDQPWADPSRGRLPSLGASPGSGGGASLGSGGGRSTRSGGGASQGQALSQELDGPMHGHGRPAPPDATTAPRPLRDTRAWFSSWLPIVRWPLAALVAVVAVAVAIDVRALGALWAVVVLAVVDWLAAGSPWRVAVGRAITPVMTLGERGWVMWSVVPSRRWRQRVALADGLAPSLGARRRTAVTLPHGVTTTVSVPMDPTRRGAHDIEHLVVRVAGPLRLVARQHERELADHVEVHPAFPSRREAELRVTDRRVLEVGMRSVRALGAGTEFEALREYTFEDEIRRIDWSATARAGKPIVRSYRTERNQVVQVLLDTGRLSAGLVEGVTRLDHLMDVVLGLVTVAVGVGDRVGFQAFAHGVRVEVPVGRSPRQRATIGSAMAPLGPVLVESDYQDAFTRMAAQQRRRALLVVLTDLASESLLDTLVPALPVLLRRHLVVVGAVDDPGVHRMVDQPAEGVDDAYRAAGAVRLDRSRRRTARLLRQLGAVVVDEPPSRLSASVMDAYLDMKASGRL